MNNRRRNGRGAWYRVHRVLGLTSAVFVLMLAVTGLALNHTGWLGLDRQHVAGDWLLDWYGIEPPPGITAFAVGDRHVARMGRRVWLDGEPVLEDAGALRGAVRSGRFLVVALDDDLALLTADGRLVERIDAGAGAPRGIRRLGTAEDGGVIVEAEAGRFRADPTLAGWQPTRVTADWSQPVTLSAEAKRRLAEGWRGRGLSLERVLLDLHSGRILGRFGVWLMDGMALVFVALAVTGIWVWFRRRSAQRRNSQGRPN